MTLSDKIINPAVNIETVCGKHNAMIERDDVEKFIRELKEEFAIHFGINEIKAFSSSQINFAINKLAGDKLI